ncbi:hypothetical protein [Paenibacillus sp.]|uniref:hypothetical protein n=1 Tax=Paenibacillus sp. TaxID=58172 RepID=UPI002D28DFC6|nr:hypothetical protein [Paenibacillus sp.]HZG84916.1 hypothetical protein [Paenibacillus sp.]
MAVIFSEYARKRCKEEKINQAVVVRAILDIPPMRGKWMVGFGAVVLDFSESGNVVVVTVISIRKYRKTRYSKVRKQAYLAASNQ